MLDTFCELASIESPSWHEGSMQEKCMQEFLSLGFNVIADDAKAIVGGDASNVICYLPGTSLENGEASDIVAFSAHMDTVLPCAEISIKRCERECNGQMVEAFVSEGETILSADDKAGIASIIEGITASLDSNANRAGFPSIIVVLTVCEEQSLLGSGALKIDTVKTCIESFQESSSFKQDCALQIKHDLQALQNGHIPMYVLDADGAPGSAILKAPCHYTFKAEFNGRAAHAGVEPEAGVSAIEVASMAISNMPLLRIDADTTANIGTIDGGVATNIVACRCIVEGECRSLVEDKAIHQRDAMQKAMEDACKEYGATLNVEWTYDYPSISWDESNDVVVHFKQAAEALGLAYQSVSTGGGADANILQTKGFDALTLGIGMTNFHSTDEWISLIDLIDDARLVEAIIAEYIRKN